MNKPDKCKNCQWYGKPYWSIINPCDNCPMENVQTFTHWIDPNIKELEEENEKLKKELDSVNISKDNYVKLINKVGELEEENKKLKELNYVCVGCKEQKYQQRIDKALKDTEELYEMVKEQDSDNVNLIDRLADILKTLKGE